MSKTCRVIINQVKQTLHLVGYLLIRYYKDRLLKYIKKEKCILLIFITQVLCIRKVTVHLG